VGLIDALCARYRIPNRYRDTARAMSRYHGHIHRAFELRPETLVRTLEDLDAFRRPERLDAILLACEADYRGRTGFESRPYPQADHVRQALERCQSVQAREVMADGFRGPDIRKEMHRRRVQAVGSLRKEPRI
jgi:tRNA nucleotidyltransferase (CCA-adding enzyme)